MRRLEASPEHGPCTGHRNDRGTLFRSGAWTAAVTVREKEPQLLDGQPITLARKDELARSPFAHHLPVVRFTLHPQNLSPSAHDACHEVRRARHPINWLRQLT